eukprot:CAMPEP_0196660118 /NCGR_PEP_ID=MMETSP1086-20130531/38198_1 /TAXON_ID=77921 /ORGANISM="Cyanoptyche  gloeocystis , Strain SAG4.97" /LENGTH=129 /DNA_ID=CAMNT_0041994377 /DNA_START=29 /DNA_END=419 /DNA_ORIENTATION=+
MSRAGQHGLPAGEAAWRSAGGGALAWPGSGAQAGGEMRQMRCYSTGRCEAAARLAQMYAQLVRPPGEQAQVIKSVLAGGREGEEAVAGGGEAGSVAVGEVGRERVVQHVGRNKRVDTARSIKVALFTPR